MEAITREVAWHVLWHYGPEGSESHRVEPGSFTAALIKAIALADPSNRLRLRLGFPGYVTACDLIEHDPAGVNILIAIARGDTDDSHG